jgi:adenylosuccinate lyase
VYSGQLLLELVEQGVPREDAYRWVQRNAMRVWDEGVSFLDGILADADIGKHLKREAIERVFRSDALLDNVQGIFDRVFHRGQGANLR